MSRNRLWLLLIFVLGLSGLLKEGHSLSWLETTPAKKLVMSIPFNRFKPMLSALGASERSPIQLPLPRSNANFRKFPDGYWSARHGAQTAAMWSLPFNEGGNFEVLIYGNYCLVISLMCKALGKFDKSLERWWPSNQVAVISSKWSVWRSIRR